LKYVCQFSGETPPTTERSTDAPNDTALIVVVFSLEILWDNWTSPTAYLIVSLLVAVWAWIFRRALRRMHERKQRLDASIPPNVTQLREYGQRQDKILISQALSHC
jgi:hypothetical protein